MSDSERMQLVFDYSNAKNISDFARSIGHHRPEVVRRVLNNINNISANLARYIVKRYPEINYQWLLTGEGQMLIEKPPAEITQPHAGNHLPPAPVQTVDNLTRALGIIESQQESIKQLTEATLIQARSLQDIIVRNEANGQTPVSSKAG